MDRAVPGHRHQLGRACLQPARRRDPRRARSQTATDQHLTRRHGIVPLRMPTMSKSVLHTSLCDDLKIEYPVFLAGMGVKGNATPPKLVATVSEAGGMGILGCSWLDADEVRRRIRAVRNLTDKPFGVDLLLPASMDESSVPDRAEMRARIERDFPKQAAFGKSLSEKFGLKPVQSQLAAMSPEFIRRQVDVCLEEKIAVFAAGLGDPGWVVPLAKQANMKVMGLVGNVRNAERQKKAGVDYVIAQGYEAGGHTGTIANFPLIPMVVDAVAPTPVIAAGAIADGRTVAAGLALGAVGVWVGTAFLLAEESNIFPRHQEEIIKGAAEDFIITRAYTGKTARDYKNDVIKAWDESGLKTLPMPLQGVLMDDFIAAAEAANRAELINNPVGQIAGMLKQKRPAKEIMMSMVHGAEEVIERLSAMRK
ncbi:MAG: nitronate monooxygenase [Alphaproteobacteria bacterium]|nr:nitronate monooxygenase [Alphaproteobacteria bacterium]